MAPPRGDLGLLAEEAYQPATRLKVLPFDHIEHTFGTGEGNYLLAGKPQR